MTKDYLKHSNHRQCPANVLIVDGQADTAGDILRVLARRGLRGIVAHDHRDAFERLEKDDYSFVIATAGFDTAISGREQMNYYAAFAGNIKADRPELPLAISARIHNHTENPQCLVDITIEAIRAGFCELITSPIDDEKLENIFSTYLPNHDIATLAGADEQVHHLYTIVGKSSKLSQTINLARRIAPTSAPALITGESGTGKELIAYMIHQQSNRANAPYVRINCAALSETLLESELFGHEKGAFTGAYTQRKGKFESAHGGTLLLDEITETPPRFQANLLRILEQQDFERVGGNDSIKVNVRIISTTNRDLAREVQENRFRADLYYRLSGVRLIVAPLRQRQDDLEDLTWHFINQFAAEVNRRITELDTVMMDIFRKYHWPGNVRQLRNVVRTSMILGNGPVLSLADVSWLFDELQPRTQHSAEHTEVPVLNSENNLAGIPLARIERRAIIETLNHTRGNQTKAAKVLGISDRTLRGKIKKYREEGVLETI